MMNSPVASFSIHIPLNLKGKLSVRGLQLKRLEAHDSKMEKFESPPPQVSSTWVICIPSSPFRSLRGQISYAASCTRPDLAKTLHFYLT